MPRDNKDWYNWHPNNPNSWYEQGKHKKEWLPPTPEDAVRQANLAQQEAIRKSRHTETVDKVKAVLGGVLTPEQLEQVVFVRQDPATLVAIPADILLVIFTKHEEVIEELRQIIDGLS